MAQNPIPSNDAAGGAGSLSQSLLGIAVNGISRAADGYLSRKFPLTSFNESQTVDSTGRLRPSSAPQKNVSATDKAAGIVQNPIVIGSAIAVVVAVALILALRK